jgi:type II secretory pathway pseudopilin PulG
MFVLLIAAIAVIALVAAVMMITRTRARGRQDQMRARQAAAAQARAAAQAEEHRRRRALDDEDNLLTSVIPAIRLPWPTQLSAPREPGYQDLDGEYPQFSTVTPFHTGPADEPPARPPWPPAEPVAEPVGGPIDGYGQPDRRENGQLVPPPRWQPAAAEQYPADPDEYPVDPDQYPAAPAIWDERLRPAPGRDARMTPAPVPAEHAAALERARRRPTHGSHRGGHARRRRT